MSNDVFYIACLVGFIICLAGICVLMLQAMHLDRLFNLIFG